MPQGECLRRSLAARGVSLAFEQASRLVSALLWPPGARLPTLPPSACLWSWVLADGPLGASGLAGWRRLTDREPDGADSDEPQARPGPAQPALGLSYAHISRKGAWRPHVYNMGPSKYMEGETGSYLRAKDLDLYSASRRGKPSKETSRER